MGAWKASLEIMWAEYAKLPSERPGGCYVCTAASQGHAWLVGRHESPNEAGTNDQTRTLRRFEREVLVRRPRLHCLLRAIYNRIGPILAAMLFRPILADIAYLSLKPAEWAARAVLARRS